MPVRSQSNIRTALAAACMLGFLTACGPGFEAARSGSRDFSDLGDEAIDLNKVLTGYKDPDGRSYTAISDDGEFQRLIARTEGQDAAGRALAARVRGVEFVKTQNHVRARLTLEGVPAPLAFEGNLDASTRVVRGLRASGQPTLALAIACSPDDDCVRAVFVLTEQRAGQSATATASFIRRDRMATVSARRADQNWSSATALQRTLANILQTPRRRFVTLEVRYGISTYWLDLSSANLCPAGRMIDTSDDDDEDEVIGSLGCPEQSPPENVTGVLAGNSTLGAAILRFDEGSARLFVVVDAETRSVTQAPDFFVPGIPTPPEPPPSPPNPLPNPQPGPEPGQPDDVRPGAPGAPPADALIQVDLSHPATRALDAHRTDPQILAALEEVKRGALAPRMRAMLTVGRAMAPAMAEILAQQGVPREIIFVTLQESAFLTNPSFPIQPNGQGSTALGPWQFLEGTGRGYGLRVLPLERGQANPCDERADWRKSTRAAGRYFSDMLRQFQNDSLLAVLGFRSGHNRVENARRATANRQRMESVGQSGVSYWTVRRFNMVPRLNQYHSYIMRFAAAQMIGRAPREHGFTLGPPSGPMAPTPVCSQ